MEDGLLSLKWNNHKSTFCEILPHLREKAKFTDCTVAVDSKFYNVHRLVLSTCSEYFNEIFDITPCKSPVIVLKDVRYQDIEALLDYMYLGEVNVSQNDLASLLKTAECLKIKGLAIPDDDPPKPEKSTDVNRLRNPSTENLYSPPSKKRRHHDSSEVSSRSQSPALTIPTSTQYPIQPDTILKKSTSEEQEEAPPVVKVELEDDHEDDSFINEEDFDSRTKDDCGKDLKFGTKSEVNSPTFSSNNFFSSQLMGDLGCDNNESSSFPQESFTGDSLAQSGDQSVNDDNSDSQLQSTESGMMVIAQQARICQLCNVTLANANLLRRHVEDHHFHIRKYECSHCGKKFKRKEHRERHERIHTGVKPFACTVCNSRFTQKEHLKGHMENIHLKVYREKEAESSMDEEKDLEKKSSSSSPPSLASPSSITSMVTSSCRTLASLLPLTNSQQPLLTLIPASSGITSNPLTGVMSIPGTSTAPNPTPSGSTTNPNKVTALYAPVNRKNANSPDKHVQTITINFN